jgi:hypothetical protein
MHAKDTGQTLQYSLGQLAHIGFKKCALHGVLGKQLCPIHSPLLTSMLVP